MEGLEGTAVVLAILVVVAVVTMSSIWLLRNLYYRPLVRALLEILDYLRFQTACEAREAYLVAHHGQPYALEEFVFVLGCFENQHAATVRERTGCPCGRCTKEYALSFHIRRRRQRKKHQSAWLEAGQLVPLRT